MDRGSTFENDEVGALLREKFVPVAIDVFYHERRKDAEGEFYRKVVQQRRGLRPGRTTQGFYIFTPHGSLIVGWNHRAPERVLRHLRGALEKQHDMTADELKLEADARYVRPVPEGALVVDVYSKVLGAEFTSEASWWKNILRASTGRDHLWITKAEVGKLTQGEWPPSLTQRILRFHLIDNTRGEPPMWRRSEVESESWKVEALENGLHVRGVARARTADKKRGYDMGISGRVETSEGRVTRFDVVARGRYWGGGRWSSNDLPKGKFRFAVAFRIAAATEAAKVPPQATRDLRAYLGTK